MYPLPMYRTMKQKAYFNKAQLYLHEVSPNSKVLICGRRFGKSDGVMGPDILFDVQHMPGSTGWIYGATFKQLLSRTLPATEQFWRRYNYRRDYHYFIGRKAPKWMNFQTPVIEPIDWDKCIHFYNGTVVHLLSQDVQFSANSLTADWGKADEARSIRKEKMFEEAIPTLSGSHMRFASCHKWKGLTIVTDMPTSKRGQWVLEMENRMDRELITAIEYTIGEINYLKDQYASMPELPGSARQKLNRLKSELHFLRSKAFMYKEYDTIENIELLGPDYIRQMKRDLPPVTFQISIMTRKVRNAATKYYSALDPDIHYYDANNNEYIMNLRTAKGTIDIDRVVQDNCLHDQDIDFNTPLAIALDYNSAINWVVTGQRLEPEMKTLSSFFVKSPRKIRELCQKWCDYYEPMVSKRVIYYYNETALHKGYADEESESFAEIVYAILSRNRWDVEMVFIGKPWKHSVKHQAIDDALKGKKGLFPVFNRGNNPHLLPALELAETKMGRTGFEKDKSGEKHGDTEDDPLELRTDGTDAWDDLFIGLNYFPRQLSSSYMLTRFG